MSSSADNADECSTSITVAAQRIFQFSSPLIIFFVRNPEMSHTAAGAHSGDTIEQTPPEIDRVLKRMESELHEVDASLIVGSSVPGAAVPLSFGRAVDFYHTGSAALHVFLILVDRKASSSRTKRAAQVAKEWREDLMKTGATEANCLIFLVHQDLVDAGTNSTAPPPGCDSPSASDGGELTLKNAAASILSRFSHQKSPVEEALDVVQDYMEELKRMKIPAQAACVYHPSSYKIKMLDALKEGYQEKAAQLKAARHHVYQSRTAPGWSIQEFWRKGYALAIHHLQFGALFEAISCFTSMFTEYYNHSDDFGFVTDWNFLRDVGMQPNVFDPLRGKNPRHGAAPLPLADESEIVDALMFIVGSEMTCSLFLGNREGALARFASFIEVVKEKIADANRAAAQHLSPPRISPTAPLLSRNVPVVHHSNTTSSTSNGGDFSGALTADAASVGVAPSVAIQHFFLFRCTMSALDLCTGANLAARVGSQVQRVINGHFAMIDERTLDAASLGNVSCEKATSPAPPNAEVLSSSPAPSPPVPPDESSPSPQQRVVPSAAAAELDEMNNECASTRAFTYSISSLDDVLAQRFTSTISPTGSNKGNASSNKVAVGLSEKEIQHYCVTVGDLCLTARNHLVLVGEQCELRHPVMKRISASATNFATTTTTALSLSADNETLRTPSSDHSSSPSASPPLISKAAQELRRWLTLDCLSSTAHFDATFLGITRVAASAFRKGKRFKQEHALLCEEAAALTHVDPRRAADLLRQVVLPYYRESGWRGLLLHAKALFVDAVIALLERNRRYSPQSARGSSLDTSVVSEALQCALELSLHSITADFPRWWWTFSFFEGCCSSRMPQNNGENDASPEPEDEHNRNNDELLMGVPLLLSPAAPHCIDFVQALHTPHQAPTTNQQQQQGSPTTATASAAVGVGGSQQQPQQHVLLHSAVTDHVLVAAVKKLSPSELTSIMHRIGEVYHKKKSKTGGISGGGGGSNRSLGALRFSAATASSAASTSAFGGVAEPQRLPSLPRPKWCRQIPTALIDEPVCFIVLISCPVDITKTASLSSSNKNQSAAADVVSMHGHVVLHSKRKWLQASEAVHMVELSNLNVTFDETLKALMITVSFKPCHAGTYKIAQITLSIGCVQLSHTFSVPTAALLLSGVNANEGVPNDATTMDNTVSPARGGGGFVSMPTATGAGSAASSSTSTDALNVLVVPEPDVGIDLVVEAPPELHCFGDSTTLFSLGVKVSEPLKVSDETQRNEEEKKNNNNNNEDEARTTAEGAAAKSLFPPLYHVPRPKVTCCFDFIDPDNHGLVAPMAPQTVHHGGARHLTKYMTGDSALTTTAPAVIGDVIANVYIGKPPPRRERGTRGGAGGLLRSSTRAVTMMTLPRNRTPSETGSDGGAPLKGGAEGLARGKSIVGGGGGHRGSVVGFSSSPPPHSGGLNGSLNVDKATGGGGGGAAYDAFAATMDGGGGGGGGSFALDLSTRDFALTSLGREGSHASASTQAQAISRHHDPAKMYASDWFDYDRVTLILDKLNINPITSDAMSGGKESSTQRQLVHVTSASLADVAADNNTSDAMMRQQQHQRSPSNANNTVEVETQPPTYTRNVAVTVISNEYTSKLAACSRAISSMSDVDIAIDASANEKNGYTTLSLLLVADAAAAADSDGQGGEESKVAKEDCPLVQLVPPSSSLSMSSSPDPTQAIAAAAAALKRSTIITPTKVKSLDASTLSIKIPLLPPYMKTDSVPLSFSCKRNRETSLRNDKLAVPFQHAFRVRYEFAPFQERMFVTVHVTNVLRCTSIWIRHAALEILCAEPGETAPGFEVSRASSSNRLMTFKPLKPGDEICFGFELRLSPNYHCTMEIVRHATRLCLAYSEWCLFTPDGVYPLPKGFDCNYITQSALAGCHSVSAPHYLLMDSLRELHEATSCNLYFAETKHFTSKHLCSFNAMILLEDGDLNSEDDDAFLITADDRGELQSETQSSCRDGFEEAMVMSGVYATTDASGAGGAATTTNTAVRHSRRKSQVMFPTSSASPTTTSMVAVDGAGGGCAFDSDGMSTSSKLFDVGEPLTFRVVLHPQPHNWPKACSSLEDRFFITLEVKNTDWLVLGHQRQARTLSSTDEQHLFFSAVPVARTPSVPLPSVSIHRLICDASGAIHKGEAVAVDVVQCRSTIRLKHYGLGTNPHHR